MSRVSGRCGKVNVPNFFDPCFEKDHSRARKITDANSYCIYMLYIHIIYIYNIYTCVCTICI